MFGERSSTLVGQTGGSVPPAGWFGSRQTDL